MRLSHVLPLVVLLAGCSAPVEPASGAEDGTTRSPTVRVVVADVGPGVNPYHEAFRRPGWTQDPSLQVAGFPMDAVALPLTLGSDYQTSRNADAALWEAYEEGTLYYVPGTNLLLLTTRLPPWGLPDGNERMFHGTASAHAISQACPDCYVLILQDGNSLDGEPIRQMAAEMPWVDFAASTNVPGDVLSNHVSGDYARATKAFHDAGRLFFSFAGNEPVPASPLLIYGGTSLPPWTVMVGGAHSECKGTEVLAGKPPEFVGNFTMTLATVQDTTATRPISGTSFATPQVAGSFGRALLRVRERLGPGAGEGLWSGTPQATPWLEDGVLTADEMRDVFSRVATYFAPQEFDPSCTANLPAPATPTPWVDMGWGYVGDEEAELAARVLLGDEPAPEKPILAQAHMRGHQAAREAAFGRSR